MSSKLRRPGRVCALVWAPRRHVRSRERSCLRPARAMLHLRNTLPRFFDADQSTSTLFPADIFSPHMSLKLHHPVPLKVIFGSAWLIAIPGRHMADYRPHMCSLSSSHVLGRPADGRCHLFPDTPSLSLWHATACKVSCFPSCYYAMPHHLPHHIVADGAKRKLGLLGSQAVGTSRCPTRVEYDEARLILSSSLRSADIA